jgi:hypothetical protein
MNKLLILVALLIVACSRDSGTTVSYAPPTENCSVNNNVITCPDGTTTTLPIGTVISLVQFCSGTTTYPSTFTEIGFCINNALYAVYSANSGFLTYVPPGTYNSNAINSNCTFIVQPNCVIIDQ